MYNLKGDLTARYVCTVGVRKNRRTIFTRPAEGKLTILFVGFQMCIRTAETNSFTTTRPAEQLIRVYADGLTSVFCIITVVQYA